MGLFEFFRKKPPTSKIDKVAQKMSRIDFARKVMDGLQIAGMEGLAYNGVDFCITIASQNTRFFLNNAHEEFLTAPDAVTAEQVVARHITHIQHGLASSPNHWEDAKDSILPVVRDRPFVEHLTSGLFSDKIKQVPWQPISEWIGLCLAHDTPGSMAYVNEESLSDWGVRFEEALALASENLLAQSSGPFVSLQPGLFRSPWNDCYDAARMVLPEVFEPLELKGRPVVAIPHWNALLVADSDNSEALMALAKLAEIEIQLPRNNNAPLLVLKGGRWHPYAPAADHPAFFAVTRFNAIAALRAYGDKSANLKAEFRKTGDESLIATIRATQHTETGVITSTVQWTNGIVTLLPKADRVLLFDPELPKENQILGWAPWEEVATVVLELREPIGDFFPPYYRVHRFPVPNQLARVALSKPS
jgi:hypothetical protein